MKSKCNTKKSSVYSGASYTRLESIPFIDLHALKNRSRAEMYRKHRDVVGGALKANKHPKNARKHAKTHGNLGKLIKNAENICST